MHIVPNSLDHKISLKGIQTALSLKTLYQNKLPKISV